MANKFNYSSRTLRSLRGTAKREIMQSPVSTQPLRKEIARIFQQVNRRIQNIEKSGVFSPALQALGELPTGFTKFGMSNKSWTQLKMEYGKAVNFLQQPTSTATGAHEYNEQVRQKFNIPKASYDVFAQKYADKLASLSGTAFIDAQANFYNEVSGDFEQSVQSAAAQLENDAMNLQTALENASVQAADEVGDVFENDVDELFDIF